MNSFLFTRSWKFLYILIKFNISFSDCRISFSCITLAGNKGTICKGSTVCTTWDLKKIKDDGLIPKKPLPQNLGKKMWGFDLSPTEKVTCVILESGTEWQVADSGLNFRNVTEVKFLWDGWVSSKAGTVTYVTPVTYVQANAARWLKIEEKHNFCGGLKKMCICRHTHKPELF